MCKDNFFLVMKWPPSVWAKHPWNVLILIHASNYYFSISEQIFMSDLTNISQINYHDNRYVQYSYFRIDIINITTMDWISHLLMNLYQNHHCRYEHLSVDGSSPMSIVQMLDCNFDQCVCHLRSLSTRADVHVCTYCELVNQLSVAPTEFVCYTSKIKTGLILWA